MKVASTVALALVATSWCSSVRADFDLKSYRDLSRNEVARETIRGYTTGVGRGIFYANVAIGVRGGEKLFCMPPALALDEGIIQSLLDQEIRSPSHGKPYDDEDSVEYILLRAFEHRFPCANGGKP